MSEVVVWKPDRKNGGSPLGPIYVDGEWHGYCGYGEVLGFARHRGLGIRVEGKFAAYARKHGCKNVTRNRLQEK